MIFTPETNVHLLSGVPLFIDSKHQISWNTKQDQTNYFLSKSFHASNDFSYQRETKAIAYPINHDLIYHVNYLMYKNSNFSDKWFYAYITKKEYRNDKLTMIYFDIDPFQTWYFDFEVLESFVEREHCQRWNPDGSPVINTVPENLEMGVDYETVETVKDSGSADDYYLIASTVSFKKMLESYPNMEIPDNLPMPRPQVVNGLQTGLEYYLIKGIIFNGDEANAIPFSGGTSGGGGGGGGGGAFGNYIMPVKSPYNITSPYGMRTHPITGDPTMHNGIDFGGLRYDPIYAVDGGTVELVGYNEIRGYYVVLKHGVQEFTVYQHLDSYSVSKGQDVFQGQIIGKMGSTGSSTGNHLHFETCTGIFTGYYDPATKLPI